MVLFYQICRQPWILLMHLIHRLCQLLSIKGINLLNFNLQGTLHRQYSMSTMLGLFLTSSMYPTLSTMALAAKEISSQIVGFLTPEVQKFLVWLPYPNCYLTTQRVRILFPLLVRVQAAEGASELTLFCTTWTQVYRLLLIWMRGTLIVLFLARICPIFGGTTTSSKEILWLLS